MTKREILPKRGHAVLDQQGKIAHISGTKEKGTQFYIDTYHYCHRIDACDLTQIKLLKPAIIWRFARNFADLDS
tara:strand:- start:891 stop:1112 length:222 start_codon:yes stop_codon:yes gene_type:complete